MRLAWFTPFTRASAIGTFSRHVVERLAQEADVRLWVAADDETLQDTSVEVVRFEDASALAADEVPVYNFGNYLPYHRAIYEASRERPGIAVLHDRVLHPMFATYWLTGDSPDPNAYVGAIRSLYGGSAARRAAAALRGDAPAPWELDDELLRQPLYEEAIVGAEGVISHSARHADEIAAGWLGPVRHLHLPCYDEVLAAGAHSATLPVEPRDDGRLRMLVVGHVNPNKRIDKLLELLADDPGLADRLHLDVVGSQAYEAYVRELVELAESLADRVSVVFHGVVGDDVLEQRLAEADLYVNLRHPAMESASASLMEQLAYGKPVLAFDTGFFAEVPDDAIVRVGVEDWEACGAALRELVTDPSRRRAIGERARDVAASYSVDAYVSGLLAHVNDVRRWRPSLGALDRAMTEVGRFGFDADSPVVEHLSHEAGELFGAMWAATPSGSARAVRFQRLDPSDREALRGFLAANDVPAVTRTFDPFPMRAETADQLLDGAREDRYYGAFVDGELVALSMLRGWDEGYEVPSFGIAVDHRRHGDGIGGRLTRWTVSQARATGAPAVRLSVYTDNPSAVRLYEAIGFAELERSAAGARERVVMRLTF
jgi:glycosyltransferase involved in cell wall biosynthesis/ribosomal protein S18 acetylase RimI-like enzyme